MDEELEIDPEAAANERALSEDDELIDEEERAEGKVAKLRKELEAARKECRENMNGWQRSKADYVNALRRFEDEKKGARDEGMERAVETLLPALDALERAKAHGEVPPSFQGIVKQLEGAFASLGIEPLGSIGEAFDPRLHEALGQDAVPDATDDETVTAVLEQGWKRGERVIRPAKVRVGRHG